MKYSDCHYRASLDSDNKCDRHTDIASVTDRHSKCVLNISTSTIEYTEVNIIL